MGNPTPLFTVIHARYVIPVRPARVVLEHHSVVLQGETIVECLPTPLAKSQYADADEVNLPGHVLIPGLINMHTHSPMTLLRGIADDLQLEEWLGNHIWPIERQFVSAEFVADGTRLAMAEMLRAGTSCFNENYFFPDVMAEVAKQTGIRACIGLPVIELPTAWAGNVEECLDKGLAVLERWRGDRLVSFSLAPHAPYSVSDETLKKLAELSNEQNLPIHIHLLEAHGEIKQSLQAHGVRPLQRMQQLHLVNSRLLAVHMTQLSGDDINILSEAGTHVIHCPQSNLKLANGICPVSELQAAGVNIAIGTDGAASNNNLDLLSEAQTAALMTKNQSGDARSLDAFEVLEMLTINGARALGMESQIGTIEAGKLADLAALDFNVPETQPVYNAVSQLIYAASSRQFTEVWVAGRRLLQNGVLMTLDLNGILAAAETWRLKLS